MSTCTMIWHIDEFVKVPSINLLTHWVLFDVYDRSLWCSQMYLWYREKWRSPWQIMRPRGASVGATTIARNCESWVARWSSTCACRSSLSWWGATVGSMRSSTRANASPITTIISCRKSSVAWANWPSQPTRVSVLTKTCWTRKGVLDKRNVGVGK